MIKAFIGIGNSEKKFNCTRHNLGIIFIKKLSKFFNKKLIYNKSINGYYSYFNLYNKNILIYYPKSMMNECGIHIKNILYKYNIYENNFVIIHDDISFKPGESKLKFGGSSAGHKGLESIINNINSKKFYRIRIGIGRYINKNIRNYVLSNPTKNEMKLILKSINYSLISIIEFIKFGPIKSMNFLNSKK